MGWVRVDDSFYDHQKFIDVGPLGIAQWVVGLAWCNRNLSDGFIPSSRAHHLLAWDGIAWHMWSGELLGGGEDADGEDVSHLLVQAGVWEKTDGGYLIHDYHKYQPTAEEVKGRQEETRAAKTRAGQLRAAGASRTSTGQFVSPDQTSTASTSASTHTSSSPAPTPTPTNTTTCPPGFENDFEECWNLYPRKEAKTKAQRGYVAQRRKGATVDGLLTASRQFAEQMRREKRDRTKIMLGSTFFGPDDRWKDFVDGAPGLKDETTTGWQGVANGDRSIWNDIND